MQDTNGPSLPCAQEIVAHIFPVAPPIDARDEARTRQVSADRRTACDVLSRFDDSLQRPKLSQVDDDHGTRSHPTPHSRACDPLT